MLGPQIVVIDAMCEGIGQQGVTASFQRRVHEIRVFLGFVLGLDLRPARTTNGWVWELDAHGRIVDCVLRTIGYFEVAPSSGFPDAGTDRPIERREVARPGLGQRGIWPDMLEQWVPADIEVLWDTFTLLPDRKRDQLMRAGNAFQAANAMWPDHRTAGATFLVVACEALKASGRRHERENIYDVVAELLGDDAASRLRGLVPKPQTLRSGHVHRGELAAGELLPMMMNDYFADPSFDDMIQELSRVTRTCLIEWLRREAAPRPAGRRTKATEPRELARRT